MELKLRLLAGCLIGLLIPNAILAQTYTGWVNKRIDEVKAARINQRSNTNQTEAPSASGNSTSLVDHSSVSDLIGVALNLAELSGASADNKEATSASVTITAYALYAGFKGADPLSPSFYNQNRNWRRLSLTLGYDNEKDSTTGGSTDRVTIVGGKFLLWNRRDASDPSHAPGLRNVSLSLQKANVAFINISAELKQFLFEHFGEMVAAADKETFVHDHLDSSAAFGALQNRFTPADLEAVDKIIEKHLDPFLSLDAASRKAVESIRRAPQFSIEILSKLRKNGADEYNSELIFDYGVHPRINFTANGKFEFTDNKTGPDLRGGSVTGQFSIQLTPESKLSGRKPITFSFGGEGKWMTQSTPVYKGQTKISIPIFDGIDFPLSFTFASRTDLINEKDIRGQFGFTFDVSRLIAALK